MIRLGISQLSQLTGISYSMINRLNHQKTRMENGENDYYSNKRNS